MTRAIVVVIIIAPLGYPRGLDDSVRVAPPPAHYTSPTASTPPMDVVSRARILFVGDLLYDRSIRQKADQHGDEYIFSCIADWLRSYDLVVANLENPITAHSSVSVGSVVKSPQNYQFTAPLRTPEVLYANNIRAVSIGNNHIHDFGRDGIRQTRAALDAAGIVYVGDPTDASSTSALLPLPHTVALVSFNEFLGPRDVTIPHIQRYPSDTTVIVFAHWGDEYATTSAPRQRTWAREFIEAGADLVIGAHPHVIQEHEVYQEVSIYYSLGNFIFDQYWNESVRSALALEVVVGSHGIEGLVEHPLRINRDGTTCLRDAAAAMLLTAPQE